MHNLDTSSSYYNPMSSAQDNGRHFDSPGGSNFNQSGRHLESSRRLVDIQGRHLDPHGHFDMNDKGDFNNPVHKGNQ